MRIILLVLLVAVAYAMAEDSAAPATPAAWGTDLDIVDLADRLGFYSYLLAAKETGLTETLRTQNPITLFIPTNEAFLSLNQTTRDFWAADQAFYKKLMMYHIIQGAHTAEQLTNEQLYPTLDNSSVRIDAYNSTTPTPFKDYANSRIIQTNFKATNGYIHVISDVVLEIENKTILARVAESKDLSMFFNATAKVTGLQAKLNTTIPYTLFAPTNAAIDSLPIGDWEKLLANESALAEVLNYHITTETYFSNGLVTGDHLTTLNTLANLTVAWHNDKLFINAATVIEANNAALNGVVHVIDKVLIPTIQ